MKEQGRCHRTWTMDSCLARACRLVIRYFVQKDEILRAPGGAKRPKFDTYQNGFSGNKQGVVTILQITGLSIRRSLVPASTSIHPLSNRVKKNSSASAFDKFPCVKLSNVSHNHHHHGNRCSRFSSRHLNVCTM